MTWNMLYTKPDLLLQPSLEKHGVLKEDDVCAAA